ncbi:MAG: alpha/beta fold hydrolase [Gammaproteobacteria bacterium]
MSAAVRTFDAVLPHGITLACRINARIDATGTLTDAAAELPRVVLLHGFPEGAFAWDEVLERLAGKVVAVAPDLRGFGRSSAPTAVEAYQARALVQDIVALIERVTGAPGAPIDLLVAHDWGGAVAWNLAMMRPDVCKRLMILNSPHPATFLRELRRSAAQQEASAYMNFLCRPDAAALLAADGYARMWGFFEKMGRSADWLTPALRERYRAHWALGLEGGLNYYRASPMRPGVGDMDIPDERVTVRVPTTVLWGEGDTALLPGLIDGLERWVPNLRTVRVPDATHWIVHDRPALVADGILRALGTMNP